MQQEASIYYLKMERMFFAKSWNYYPGIITGIEREGGDSVASEEECSARERWKKEGERIQLERQDKRTIQITR